MLRIWKDNFSGDAFRFDKRFSQSEAGAVRTSVCSPVAVPPPIPSARPYDEDRKTLLSACSLFRNVSPHECAALHTRFRVRSVPRGGLFFEQGGPVVDLYVVSHGAVKLVRVDRDGRQVTLRIVTYPEPFGIVAAVTGRTCYSAQALIETEALRLDAATFRDVMASYPCVAQNVSRFLASWLADSWERLDDLSVRRRVGQRVARALLRYIEPTHRGARPQQSTTLVLSHQDLAEIVGASRFTVCRVLSAWERTGIVAVKRGRLVVRSAEGLAAMAESGAAGETKGAGAGCHSPASPR